MTIENIVQIAYEINAAFCRSIGDESQPIYKIHSISHT